MYAFFKDEFNELIRQLKEKIFENKNEIKENEDNNNDVQENNILNNILNEEKRRKNNLNIKNINVFNFINFKNFSKIFSREILKNLLLKESLIDDTISEIDKVIEIESTKMKEFFENIFLSLLDNISNSLTEELVDFVNKLENKYQVSSLSSKYNYNELKRQAKAFINYNFKPKFEDIIYRYLILVLFQKCAEKISNELMDCFHELLKNNKRIKGIFVSKGKENSSICLKKIKNLMDYPEDDYVKRNPKKEKKKSKYEDLDDDDENDNK